MLPRRRSTLTRGFVYRGQPIANSFSSCFFYIQQLFSAVATIGLNIFKIIF